MVPSNDIDWGEIANKIAVCLPLFNSLYFEAEDSVLQWETAVVIQPHQIRWEQEVHKSSTPEVVVKTRQNATVWAWNIQAQT